MSVTKCKKALTRQVDLMNKWKAVDTADEGLLSVRAQYQEKMVEFAQRWSKVKHFLSLLKKIICCKLFSTRLAHFNKIDIRLRQASWR